MYRRKNKRYNNQDKNTPLVNEDIYNLFNSIRYRNKTTNQFEDDLNNVIKNHNVGVENIFYQGHNLLIQSAIFENENIFKFLIENYKPQLSSSLPQCISYLYSNKNPNILNIALYEQGIPDENLKNQLANSVTQHCYRAENIKIFKMWFEKYFNELEILEITKKTIENNNKPFLKEVCYDSFWKKQVLQLIPEFKDFITNKQENYFFHIITSNDYQAPAKNDFTHSNYNLSLIANNFASTQNNSETKAHKSNNDSAKTIKSSPHIGLSKEKIALKENHQPVIIRKRKISIWLFIKKF